MMNISTAGPIAGQYRFEGSLSLKEMVSSMNFFQVCLILFEASRCTGATDQSPSAQSERAINVHRQNFGIFCRIELYL
jgi:hypothetical protein